jgi:SAM-dependent methyltransferase
MNESEYGKLWTFERSHWWFVARRRLVRSLIARYARTSSSENGSYLDVGCGTGIVLDEIGRGFNPRVGLDISQGALGLTSDRVSSPLVCGDASELPFADNSFDLISCLDVLEHVRNDLGCIRECFRICKPGGYMVFSAPAMDFLWSEHDEAIHHLRRYSWRSLRKKLEEGGFHVVKATYAVFTLLAPIMLIRFVAAFRRSRIEPQTALSEVPRWVNQILIVLHSVESALSLAIGLPFGTGLVGVVRKESA